MRVEHLPHLGCEVSAPDILQVFERYSDDPLVELASVMDHEPQEAVVARPAVVQVREQQQPQEGADGSSWRSRRISSKQARMTEK